MLRTISRRTLPSMFMFRCQSTSTTSSSSAQQVAKDVQKDEDKEEESFAPRPLRVALGVKDRPLTTKQMAIAPPPEPMSYETLLDRRKILMEEIMKGYFHDYHQMRSHGGKLWVAPTRLIRSEMANYMPTITGQPLVNSVSKSTTDLIIGKVSLLSIFSTTFSQHHVESFTKPWLRAFPQAEDSKIQLVQVNVQENIMKCFLVKLFKSSIRKNLAPALQRTYLISGNDLLYLRKPTGMINSLIGYVFLLDECARIRWAGCGEATEKELESMIEGAKILQRRLVYDKR